MRKLLTTPRNNHANAIMREYAMKKLRKQNYGSLVKKIVISINGAKILINARLSNSK